MLAIKRFCYIEVPFIHCTVKPRSSLEPAQYTHLIVTDSLLCPWGKKVLSFSSRLITSPSEYRHILSTAPSVSGFTGFACIISLAESIAYF